LWRAIDAVPGDLLCPNNCRFVQDFDAEIGDLIESCPSVVDSMAGRARIRAECFASSASTISTSMPPLGFAESVADDVSETGFFRQWVFSVWVAETLHCF
jgi:hypothetical protein